MTPANPARQTRVALRFYRSLLLGYPRAFRERYGEVMEAAFLEDRSRAADGSRVQFWSLILRDTAVSSLQERLSRFTRGRRQGGPALPEFPRKSPYEMLHDLLRDARYSLRVLAKSPSYTLVAVSLLALGIGANTVVYTLVDTLFMNPPNGIASPAELVRVTRTNERTNSAGLAYPDFELFRERNRSFTGITAFDPDGLAVTVGQAGSAARSPARAVLVTGNYFDVLGVTPALGRNFLPEEDAVPRERAVAILAHAFWQRALGADPNVVGSDITLNGHPFTVVGVAPLGFGGVSPADTAPDLWAPVMMQPVLSATDGNPFIERVENQTINWLQAVARLAPGVSIEQARADLDGINAHLLENFGDWNEGQGTFVTHSFMYQPGPRDRLIGFTRLLAAVVGAVLLIVCANIAILQLARASQRQREIGIRAALGAARSAVVRQLLVESLVLLLAGAVTGYLLAIWLSGLAVSLIPMSLTADFRPDASVLAFTVVVASGAAILFGLAPALIASRADVVRAITARAAVPGRSGLRNGLVVAQVAVSLVLVTGAALFVRSLMHAEAVNPGFATEGRVFLSLNPRNHGYTPEDERILIGEVLERLESMPQVSHASLSVMTPFQGAWTTSFNPSGDDSDEAGMIRIYMNGVGPGYFDTMGISLLAGRDFTLADVPESGNVLIVSEAAAETLWPGEDPVGKLIALRSDEPVDLVIGVVSDSNYRALGEEPQPVVYAAALQVGFSRLAFIAATPGDAARLAPTLQREILAIDPDLAFTRVRTIEEAIESEIGTYRLGARAVGLFGALAALLAAVGLYGVLSYLVAAETREIGIRMALGATTRGVIGSVVGRGLKLAIAGVALGVILALALANTIASMLYRVSPYDPLSFIAVPLALTAVAVLASLLPARRASRVDPMQALRAD